MLLVLPAVVAFSPSNSWDVSPLALLMVTVWAIASTWFAAGPTGFFVLTYPFALFGLCAAWAGAMRQADLLEILLLSGGPERHEALAALSPYWMGILLAALILALVAAGAIRSLPTRSPRPRLRAIAWLVAAGCALGFAMPMTFFRAWPVNVMSLALAKLLDKRDFLATALPYGAINPRAAGQTWKASRPSGAPSGRETYILIIGESVRADRLGPCGGNALLALRHEAITFCDVISGASGTHLSVPLLISRDSADSAPRVSSDATFMKAFEEVGFETYWLSVQDQSIAWPDAMHSTYLSPSAPDRETLIGPLKHALAAPGLKKLIVLHGYGAHFNYCDRYRPQHALQAVDCRGLGALPDRPTRPQWLSSYDNAISESLAFVDAVIDVIDSVDAETVLLYTSDHGENLLDDGRNLVQHALATPTPWDTRVPAILWANKTWKVSHDSWWRALGANRKAHAMHGDLIPTLLGAANIHYEEPRPQVVDLGRQRPGNRIRWVKRRLGETVDGDKL
ncbi:MAG: phosphoethanolamine transferase [Ramlibacter sp.]|nr:phosphoethanolamine transferase [Ramlibacter sp.]